MENGSNDGGACTSVEELQYDSSAVDYVSRSRSTHLDPPLDYRKICPWLYEQHVVLPLQEVCGRNLDASCFVV